MKLSNQKLAAEVGALQLKHAMDRSFYFISLLGKITEFNHFVFFCSEPDQLLGIVKQPIKADDLQRLLCVSLFVDLSWELSFPCGSLSIPALNFSGDLLQE